MAKLLTISYLFVWPFNWKDLLD